MNIYFYIYISIALLLRASQFCNDPYHKAKFSFIFVSNCFVEVKHTDYWTVEPNILVNEWFANTFKKYVVLFCYQKEIN